MAETMNDTSGSTAGGGEPWSLNGFMGGLPLAGRNGLFIAAMATVFALTAIIWFASRPSFKPLFFNLPEVETANLVQQLQKMQVPYELGAGGAMISIPADRITEVRLELATLGMPQTSDGVGYEIFDSNSLIGVTDFMTHINHQRAIQGELTRTIEGIAAVRSARVHVVLPQRSAFITQSEDQKASASVTVDLARPLNAAQINGIVHLVAASVGGLNQSDVTLVDNKGNMLAGGEEEDIDGGMGADRSLALQRKREMVLQKDVQTLLDRVLGADKSLVRVSVDLNLDRVERQERIFDPDGQVARSEQFVNENSTGVFGTGGIPGVQPNDPNNTNAAAGGTGSQQTRSVERETVNYDISETVNHVRRSVGEIERLTVAVVADGSYTPAEEEGQPNVFTPLPDEQIQNLTALIQSTVNYNEARGDVVTVISQPFAPILPPEEPVSPWLTPEFQLEMAKYFVFALLVFLLIFYVLRPLVKKLLLPEKMDEDALPGTVADLERRLMAEGVGSMPSEQPVRMAIPDRTMQLAQQMINDHLDEAREILRSWMTSED